MEPIGFTNETCIYINSETKESYVPFYDRLFADDNKMSFVAIDDDTLLNNKGAINPSEKIETDLTGIKKFLYNVPDGQDIKVYSIIKTPDSSTDADKIIMKDMGAKHCFKADAVKFEFENGKNIARNYRYIDKNRWIDLELSIHEEDINGEKVKLNCNFEISDEKVSVENKNNVPLTFDTIIRMNDGSYNFAPYYEWIIGGKVSNQLSIEIQDNGMLLKSGDLNGILVCPRYYLLDDNGKITDFTATLSDNYDSIKLFTSNNILITIDEEKNVIFYIDDNGDDVYDTLVSKGDINCDGFIDAVDASKVLSIYAELSTQSNNHIDYSHADMNSDGYVDAVDASAILAEYARLSTT
jgi:hypothetical protein